MALLPVGPNPQWQQHDGAEENGYVYSEVMAESKPEIA